MINFSTELCGESDIGLVFPSVTGLIPDCGFNALGYAPGMFSNSVRAYRNSLDFIQVSEPKRYGDRECDNFQISGDVTVSPTISGGVVSWSVNSNIPTAQWRAPSMPNGFSFQEMLSVWGTTKSSSHVWKYRDQAGSYALASIPNIPVTTATAGQAKAFYGSNDPKLGRLFRTQEVVVSYKLLPTGHGSFALFFVYAIWARSYSATGVLLSSGGSVNPTFYAIGPSATGKSDWVQWCPNTNGVWTTTYRAPVLPPLMQTLTLSTFLSFVEDPTLLTAWTPTGTANLFQVPGWSPGTFPPAKVDGHLTCNLPSWEDFVEATQKAISEHFAPLLPSLVSPSEIDDWQDLGDRAADNLIQSSVNHYANALQLKQTLSILRTTLMLTKNWQDPKAWANWWLSFRYGDRLTLKDVASDANALISAIQQSTKGWTKEFRFSRSQSHTTSSGIPGRVPNPKIDHYLKMYYIEKDYGWWGKAYLFGRRWALWPTTAEGWDVIPFSFVVDWFVDVQSLFEEIDRDTLLQYVDVTSVILTEKKTYDFGDLVLGNFTLSGAKVTYYTRSLSTRLPSGPFRMDRGFSTSINVVDGISLVIQVI